MKQSLYMETTIPSYLTSRSSRDLIIAGHQQVTKEWWEKRSGAFEIYISQLVVDEASAGDPDAARERMLIVRDFAMLDITPEVEHLASAILAAGILPRKAATDAAHIAIAAVHGIDFLLTWNCAHIANAVIAKAVANICWQYDWETPGDLYAGGAVLGACSMADDYIVEEVRHVREEQAAKHAFNVKAILAAAKKRQRRSGRKVVSLVEKKTLSAAQSRVHA
jgi:hypothetical protein